jgi:predicted TIM-barrel fold metal-dependent hydrolase
MATVDSDDDAIPRWVVRHYRYDPERRERRHVVVAAFDNPDEFHADIERRAALLRARRVQGEHVDPAEHITGQAYEPGYRQRQRNAHLLRRAMEHGVVPAHIQNLELPSNVGLISARRVL